MNLNKALSKVNVKLLNTLDHGMEIELTPEYTLYHYSEEDIVVIKRVSDEKNIGWCEILQQSCSSCNYIRYYTLR